MQLGRKIRDLRLRRGLTVQQLADATGLSKGFISQVENSRTSPSLATLQDLARSLQTSVAYLVVEEEQAPHVVRRDDRPSLQIGGSPSRIEVLSAQPKRNLELLMAELPPGIAAGDKRHFHHGEEIVLCLEGTVKLTCGEHVVELEQGDACHYDGRVPHAMENTGAGPARVLVAMTPAAFEPLFRVRGEHHKASGTAQVAAPAPALDPGTTV
jgi:transcriptional regulator with XRE-family HTH domain